jgi:hypothetical protein
MAAKEVVSTNTGPAKTIHQALTQAALLVQCPDIGGSRSTSEG